MKHGTAQQAVLRKDQKAVFAVFPSSCDSVFAFFTSSFQLPPHSLEAVFLCPAAARTIVSVTSACEDTDWVKHENII